MRISGAAEQMSSRICTGTKIIYVLTLTLGGWIGFISIGLFKLYCRRQSEKKPRGAHAGIF